MFDNIAAKIADRPGGYLRIIRIGSRLGDGAELALIEFVDYNETYSLEKKAASADKKKRTRRSKSSGKDAAAPKVTETIVSEEVAEPAADALEESGDVAEESKEDDTIA